MITVIKITSEEDLQKAFQIREKVFVEEQNVPANEEYDEFENSSVHFLAFYNGAAAGTARWRKKGYKYKLERFAVLKKMRGKGVGEAILNAVIRDVYQQNANAKMYMHAQVQAVPFYEKAGFKSEGEMFLECDIEHFVMVK